MAANYATANSNINGLGTEPAATTTSPTQQSKDGPKDKKGPESLFGPNIGVIGGGPSWTGATEKKVLKDELTIDTVKAWIEKSKEPSQPTTTLQALVNLKRPTLRLHPLTTEDIDQSEEPTHSQHALEFEFDCDAPKCGIYVHVLLPAGHPEANPSPPIPEAVPEANPSLNLSAKPKYTKVLVFETTVGGGFGKVLKLEQGAVLELGRFEMPKDSKPTSQPQALPEATAVSDNNITTANTASNHPRGSRRRITQLFRRHRNMNNVSVTGPALAVVDASSSAMMNEENGNGVVNTINANNSANATDKKKDEVGDGVRVAIRLAALDEQGTELESPNEQVTYLSVERFGVKSEKKLKITTPTENVAESSEQTSTSGEAVEAPAKKDEEGAEKAEESEEDAAEDNRPWVVKVVKREATIGPHTFQLHEIYGLTSSSSHTTHAPTAPLPGSPASPSQQHTYPPQPPIQPAQEEDDSLSECLLCLSSPREVVLLPCRHLVACKECALNMVEFGAGGAITQSTSDDAAANGTGGGADNNNNGGEGGNAENGGATTATATAPTTTNTRRKRKAKGWFCPVCRQPYTSLLRITTNPPPLSASAAAAAEAKEVRPTDSQDEERDFTDAVTSNEGLPLPVTTPGASTANNSNSNTGVGGLLSRPGGFLRSLTSRGGNANETPIRRDVESQA